jgi:hypothetical protein
MPTRELLLSAALLGAALSSSALLSCKSDAVVAEPTPPASVAAPAPLDPNDPEALRRAAAVVATWYQKDPAGTAKVLKDSGVAITDPATFQAMADAQAAMSASAASASAAPSVAATAPAPRLTPPQKRPPSTISAPVT